MPEPSGDLTAYARIVDPSVSWALGPGRAFYFKSEDQVWMPILLRLAKISAADFARGTRPDGTSFIDEKRRKWWPVSVVIPEFYKTRDKSPADVEFCTALVTGDFFAYLKEKENDELRAYVAGVTLGLPLPADSLPSPPTEPFPPR